MKGNLVFMYNLYQKVAVASVCTALGFALGANKEAKAATFNSFVDDPAIIFHAYDGGSFGSFDGLGDAVDSVTDPAEGGYSDRSWSVVERTTASEIAALTEFSIPDIIKSRHDFNDAPTDAKISNIISAVLRIEVGFWLSEDRGLRTLGLFGYVGNGTAEASDLEAGIFLESYTGSNNMPVYFTVTPFLNGLVSNNNKFAGFAVRSLTENRTFLSDKGRAFQLPPTLIVEGEYETVPEPTTILTAAIAVGWGGWLKRKNSSQQDKTKSQG
jgi:hypothetical protein